MSINRLTWNIEEAAATTGLSVPYLRKRIAAGELITVRAGRRVLIPDVELRRFLGLPPADNSNNAEGFAILAEHRDVM